MMSSDRRARSSTLSGRVVPDAIRALKPISSYSNDRPRSKRRSAAFGTAIVASLISSPMPSPREHNDAAERDAILVRNPARLYGFG
jgi:hypothetical protein